MSERNSTGRERILEVIEYGTLTAGETRRRVEALIQAELERQDAPADQELIDAGEDLLWELGTNGEIPFESRLKENRAAVRARVKGAGHWARPALRTAGVIAAMLVLALVGDGVFHWGWLEGVSSPNQQQYIVQGFEVEPRLIQKSIAENEGMEPLSTTDWNEVVDYLGFAPIVPEAGMEGWKAQIYYASISPYNIKLTISYQNQQDKEKHILFDSLYFSATKEAYMAFEQNQKGRLIKIGGFDAYSSNNEDNVSLYFQQKNCVYQLVGNAEYHDVLRIMNGIVGG